MTAIIKSSPRRVLTIIGIGTAVSLLGDSTLYTVLPDPNFALQAAVPFAQVGILLGVNRLVRIFFNIPAGRLIDRKFLPKVNTQHLRLTWKMLEQFE
jgi:MFS family permease